jgi:hypothetical protein
VIFIDSNVVIDIVEQDVRWSTWSMLQLARLRPVGPLVTNTVVLAETAGRFDTLDTQTAFLAELGLKTHDLGRAAAYRAGVAFRAYRRAGGPKTSILADFLIGGHAATLGATLLTRDVQRFASYFPDLNLITPDTHP